MMKRSRAKEWRKIRVIVDWIRVIPALGGFGRPLRPPIRNSKRHFISKMRENPNSIVQHNLRSCTNVCIYNAKSIILSVSASMCPPIPQENHG